MISRIELVRQRREEQLRLLHERFSEPAHPRPVPRAEPYVPSRCPTPSFHEKYQPGRVFRDPDPLPGSRPRYILADRVRVASADPSERLVKLHSAGRSRFLTDRATDKIRPNSGTLEGEQLYSSFSPDRKFVLLPVTGARSRSVTPSMNATQTSMSRTLVR